MNALIALTLISKSMAQVAPPQGKSVLMDQAYVSDGSSSFSQKRVISQNDENSDQTSEPKVIEKVKMKRSSASHSADFGNLPGYYAGIDRSGMRSSDKVVFVPSNSAVKFKDVRPGDLFTAVIEQEVKASPNVPTPIVARVLSGALKGGLFLGEATLDKELKRVLLTFNKVRTDQGQAFTVKAQGLSMKGSVGLEGEYSSNSGKFFLAELGTAATAGVLDSTINRQQTVNGGFVQEPSLSNSLKTGAVSALSKTADRMAESARSAPEYTHLEGYQKIKVIVQEDPTEIY